MRKGPAGISARGPFAGSTAAPDLDDLAVQRVAGIALDALGDLAAGQGAHEAATRRAARSEARDPRFAEIRLHRVRERLAAPHRTEIPRVPHGGVGGVVQVRGAERGLAHGENLSAALPLLPFLISEGF